MTVYYTKEFKAATTDPKTFIEHVIQKTNEGYEQVMNSGTAMRYGSDSYVASAGTCQGDSGL